MTPPPVTPQGEKATRRWMELNMLGIFLPFQVDQEAVEEFNLTSDGEFKAVKSLVLGRVHGEWSLERIHVL